MQVYILFSHSKEKTRNIPIGDSTPNPFGFQFSNDVFYSKSCIYYGKVNSKTWSRSGVLSMLLRANLSIIYTEKVQTIPFEANLNLPSYGCVK